MNRQEHLLIILMEECAELQKECAKALRFGLEDHAPNAINTNEERIVIEWNDILAVGEMLLQDYNIPLIYDRHLIEDKKGAVENWLSYSQSKKTYNPYHDNH